MGMSNEHCILQLIYMKFKDIMNTVHCYFAVSIVFFCDIEILTAPAAVICLTSCNIV